MGDFQTWSRSPTFLEFISTFLPLCFNRFPNYSSMVIWFANISNACSGLLRNHMLHFLLFLLSLDMDKRIFRCFWELRWRLASIFSLFHTNFLYVSAFLQYICCRRFLRCLKFVIWPTPMPNLRKLGSVFEENLWIWRILTCEFYFELQFKWKRPSALN